MRDLDRLLRQAVADLAGEADAVSGAAPVDLMPGVRRRARRLRRTRYAGYATVLALLAAAVVLPTLALTRPAPPISVHPTPSASTPSPEPSDRSPIPTRKANAYDAPIDLVGGWTITGIGYPGRNRQERALNRRTGEYQSVPDGYSFFPAPAGQTIKVSDPGGDRIGFLDLDSRTVRWLPGRASQVTAFAWSPDARRALVATGHDAITVSIVEVASSRRVETFALDPARYPCTGGCRPGFGWTPDGAAVWATTSAGVRLFDPDTGAPGRLLPLAGIPESWSPDGTKVICLIRDADGRDGARMEDASTGRVIRDLPAGGYVWATPDRLLLNRAVIVGHDYRREIVTTDLSGVPLSAVLLLPESINVDFTIFLGPG